MPPQKPIEYRISLRMRSKRKEKANDFTAVTKFQGSYDPSSFLPNARTIHSAAKTRRDRSSTSSTFRPCDHEISDLKEAYHSREAHRGADLYQPILFL